MEQADWLDAHSKKLHCPAGYSSTGNRVVETFIQAGVLWEMAPSKLVPTVRAPLGRRKSRICICGNMLEGDSKKSVDNYAGGADSLTLRAALRLAALKSCYSQSGRQDGFFVGSKEERGEN